MTIEYRQITDAEQRQFWKVVARGFGGHYTAGQEN